VCRLLLRESFVKTSCGTRIEFCSTRNVLYVASAGNALQRRISSLTAHRFEMRLNCCFLARGATFGRSYEASDQIPHGGSVFDSGYPIPFYSPGMLHVEC
jgi:hypothetical protein